MNQLTDSYTLHNGVQIPCVGFGTWKTPDGDVAENSVRTAIEAGYRHIDTAALQLLFERLHNRPVGLYIVALLDGIDRDQINMAVFAL